VYSFTVSCTDAVAWTPVKWIFSYGLYCMRSRSIHISSADSIERSYSDVYRFMRVNSNGLPSARVP
jgi:hypothetical protein